MKKHIFSLFAAALLLLSAGCSKDGDGPGAVDPQVVGEWHLVAWSDEAHADFDVWIEFTKDGTFHIFQQVETSAYVSYSGDFSTEGTRIRGRYSDGEAWSTDYDFALSADGATLTMTAGTPSAEVSVYAKTPIPEAVRNVREVRSGPAAGFRRVF